MVRQQKPTKLNLIRHPMPIEVLLSGQWNN